MNNRFQRFFFNETAFFSLIKQLRYHYGSNMYRQAVRRKNLRECLNAAYKIPFYRKRFEDSGITPNDIKDRKDLAKLPILTKDEFREWMEAEKGKKENKLCMVASTSGSTGRPLQVLNTPSEYASDISTVLRAWIMCGFNPFTKKTLTEYDDTSEDVGYKTFIQRLGILKRDVVNADGDIDEIVNKINNYKPDLLRMYKSELMRIAIKVQKDKVSLFNPPFFCVIGENLDPLSEKVLRNTFTGAMINLYGCVEAGTFAVRKPGELDYELLDDMTTANIYDEHDRLTDMHGRIIFSTLYKNHFPLINYEIHDRARIIETERGLYFKDLTGRDNDNVVYSDGEMTPWVVFWNIAAKQEGIFQMRLVQNTYKDLIIEVVPKNNNAADFDRIEKKLIEELKMVTKERLSICVKWMNEIKPDAKGKIRMVVNNIKD